MVHSLILAILAYRAGSCMYSQYINVWHVYKSVCYQLVYLLNTYHVHSHWEMATSVIFAVGPVASVSVNS